jgi:hypothetical protein
MYIKDTHGFCQSKSYTADHTASYSAFVVTAVLVTSTTVCLSPPSLSLLYFVHWASPCPCCDQFQFQDFVGYVYLHSVILYTVGSWINHVRLLDCIRHSHMTLFATVLRVHAFSHIPLPTCIVDVAMSQFKIHFSINLIEISFSKQQFCTLLCKLYSE